MITVGTRVSVRPTLLVQRPCCRVSQAIPNRIPSNLKLQETHKRHVTAHAAASFPGSSDEEAPIDLLESLDNKGMMRRFLVFVWLDQCRDCLVLCI